MVASVAKSVERWWNDKAMKKIPNDGERSNRNHGIQGLGGQLRGQRLACQYLRCLWSQRCLQENIKQFEHHVEHLTLNSYLTCSSRQGVLKTNFPACHLCATCICLAKLSLCPARQSLSEFLLLAFKWLGVFLLPTGWLRTAWNSSVVYLLTQSCTPGWREALCDWSMLPKNTRQQPWPGLEHRLLDSESNTLIIRPL